MANEQKVANEQKPVVKVKKSHAGRAVGPVAAIVVVLALLLKGGLGGIGFGNGQSGDRSGSADNGTNEAQETSDIQQTLEQEIEKVTAAPGTTFFTIEVRESDIYVNDALVTLEQMKEMLQTAEAGSRFVLKENHAIKGTYDSVRGTLHELGIAFLEGEG